MGGMNPSQAKGLCIGNPAALETFGPYFTIQPPETDHETVRECKCRCRNSYDVVDRGKSEDLESSRERYCEALPSDSKFDKKLGWETRGGAMGGFQPRRHGFHDCMNCLC